MYNGFQRNPSQQRLHGSEMTNKAEVQFPANTMVHLTLLYRLPDGQTVAITCEARPESLLRWRVVINIILHQEQSYEDDWSFLRGLARVSASCCLLIYQHMETLR